MNEKPLKVVRLTAENIKRLSAVEITPTGDVIVIGGKNGAGKSSVLDSIAYAVGGQKLCPAQPIRHGQQRAKVQVDLGDLVVTRTFTTGGGGQLVVTDKAGTRQPSPQAILDRLVGRLTFDPLAFATMDPAKQRDTLRAIAGLDTSDLDTQRTTLYDQRREANAAVKTISTTLQAMPHFPEAPSDIVSTDEIRQQIAGAEQLARAAQKAQGDAAYIEQAMHVQEDQLVKVEQQIAELVAKVGQLRKDKKEQEDNLSRLQVKVEERKAQAETAARAVPSVDALTDQLERAHELNGQVEANTRYCEQQAAFQAARKRADDLDAAIARVDYERLDRIGAAKYPIEGLSLNEGAAVEYHDVPFEQLSSAEKLQISVAVGLELNPQLKVLLIREGSALDSNGLKLIAQLAAEAGAQVWLERVSETKEGVSVLIEDGAVAS